MSKKRLRQTDPEKERYWRELVQGQGGSGQSVREYCRGAGVKESAFYWWRRELARRSEVRKTVRSSVTKRRSPSGKSDRRSRPRRGRPATAMPPGGRSAGYDPSPFVPVRLTGGSALSVAAVEIHFGDGRMVRVGPGVDRQTLVDVLRALEIRPC